jgi:hypothetical protein
VKGGFTLLSPRWQASLLLTALVGLQAGASFGAPRNAANPASGKILDQGVFLLGLAGHTVGTERFQIRLSSGKIEAHADIRLHFEQNGKTVDVEDTPDLVMDRQLNPLTYSWTQKGSPAYRLTVDFRSSPARIVGKPEHGAEDRREVTLPKDVIVLDDNVIHHFQLVVDRYYRTAGGKQTFKAFVPQEGLPGELQVEEVGKEPVTIGGQNLTLRHLMVTSDLAHIDLWIDEHQHLERLAIPEKQFEAIRSK